MNLEYANHKISITIGLVLVLAVGVVLLPTQTTIAAESVCDFQHKECFTKEGYPACYKRIDLDKYYEFLDAGQNKLAEQIIYDEDRCIILKGNEKAFLQDKSKGKVKFGIRGQDRTYWALREALFSRQ